MRDKQVQPKSLAAGIRNSSPLAVKRPLPCLDEAIVSPDIFANPRRSGQLGLHDRYKDLCHAVVYNIDDK